MIRADILGKYEPGVVRSFEGGSIPNAVPDKASAVLHGVSYDEVLTAVQANSTGAVIRAEAAETVISRCTAPEGRRMRLRLRQASTL